MINGDPPFMGDSQLDQLIEIIKILGTPSKNTVLEMNKNYDMRDYKYPVINTKDWRKVDILLN
jgi:glycogen synthase kinase 3 beta